MLRKLHCSILFFVLPLLVFSQSIKLEPKDASERAKLKALIISNFTKYTVWPENAVKDEYVIGVLDDNMLFEALTLAVASKTIDAKSVRVEYYTNLSEAKNCHVFFADVSSEISAIKLFQAIENKPVLLVTDGYPYNSTMLNFIMSGNKLKFQLNRANIERQNLKLNKVIDKLADSVSNEKTQLDNELGEVTNEKDWKELLEVANQNLEEEKLKSDELQYEVVKLSGEYKNLHKDRKELEENIQEQNKELEKIYDRIRIQKSVYQQIISELDAKSNEIESKEKDLEEAEKKLQIHLKKLEETTRQSLAMEKQMNLVSRLLDNQKRLNFIVIAIAIIISLLGGIAYRNYRAQIKLSAIIFEQKREVESQRDEIHGQHEQLEEKNREITDSINYAKRIQTAILPPFKLVTQYLENSFILYKPKDIVAGDFYWLESLGDTVLFAAADCTGHGVPGAMVSVICVNGLNRSVREFGLRTPAEILDKTRELVIKEFEKSEEEVKDGMDISLCALNTKTNELQWAGANNPLWIVTSRQISDFSDQADGRQLTAENLSLYEIKANKQPIGKYGLEKPFTNHSIQLEKGDTIYIFSDGYPDQFGGERGKKYKSGNFKKTLVRLSKESIEKQKQMLDQEFETWRGTLEQIDDVCVIGVKI